VLGDLLSRLHRERHAVAIPPGSGRSVAVPVPSFELVRRALDEPVFMFDAGLFREILGIPPASKEERRR